MLPDTGLKKYQETQFIALTPVRVYFDPVQYCLFSSFCLNLMLFNKIILMYLRHIHTLKYKYRTADDKTRLVRQLSGNMVYTSFREKEICSHLFKENLRK